MTNADVLLDILLHRRCCTSCVPQTWGMMLTQLLVYAYFWRNCELHTVGLRAGDPATTRASERNRSGHLSQLALELLRRDDNAHATEQPRVERLSHLHVLELRLRAIGCKCRFAFNRWPSPFDHANNFSTSVTPKHLTSHLRRSTGYFTKGT